MHQPEAAKSPALLHALSILKTLGLAYLASGCLLKFQLKWALSLSSASSVGCGGTGDEHRTENRNVCGRRHCWAGAGREIENDLARTEELRSSVLCTKEAQRFIVNRRPSTLPFQPGGSPRRRGSRFQPGSGSGISRSETFIDTAKNISEAMGIDAIVVRHSSPGARCCFLTVRSHIINAGDGVHEKHPTQGLLDIFTILHSWSGCKALLSGWSAILLTAAWHKQYPRVAQVGRA